MTFCVFFSAESKNAARLSFLRQISLMTYSSYQYAFCGLTEQRLIELVVLFLTMLTMILRLRNFYTLCHSLVLNGLVVSDSYNFTYLLTSNLLPRKR